MPAGSLAGERSIARSSATSSASLLLLGAGRESQAGRGADSRVVRAARLVGDFFLGGDELTEAGGAGAGSVDIRTATDKSGCTQNLRADA